MPCSMAACSTVLSLSTVICRASIVNVTVSMGLDGINKDRFTGRFGPEALRREALDRGLARICRSIYGRPRSPRPTSSQHGGPMDALRVRLGSLVEWAVAAVFLTATLAVGLLIVGQLRVPRIHPSAPAARAAVAVTPSAVPAGAVSVPVLPFSDGKEIRVGDTATTVATRLGRAAESGRQE